jgi:hypothetical protein
MEYMNPRWIEEGMTVFVPAVWVDKNAKPGSGLRCKVMVACGNRGRVVSESAKYPLDRWVSLESMYIPKENQ